MKNEELKKISESEAHIIKAFGIFEGGGAKGLAHIGAFYTAYEERRIRFVGVAGTSAGAIVAALIAVGYKPKELFDPATVTGIFDVNFIQLLGAFRWKTLSILRRMIKLWTFYLAIKIISIIVFLLILSAIFIFIPKLWLAALVLATIGLLFLVNRLLGSFGIFSTQNVETWLNAQLQQKLFPNEKGKIVTFSDVPIPLVIIATNLTLRKIVLFNKENYPDCSVAKAVGASIAIPGVFRPPAIDSMVLVDGGVLSNFPAWVFDKERGLQKDIVPTFGFRLHSALSSTAETIRWKTFLGYCAAFIQTVLFGDNILEVREIEDLNLIPIKVTANTLDFDLRDEVKLALFQAGRVSAADFFRQYIGPKDPEQINVLLEFTKDKFLQELGSSKAHLRLNVALPVEPQRNKLRILYSYNMTTDADDRLVLGINEGAIGKCWQIHKPVSVDMADAKLSFQSKWNMSKYQQAMIRPTLKCLLSIPIFEPQQFDTRKTWEDNEVFAVLSVDSDDDLVEIFAEISHNEEHKLRQLLADLSFKIANALRS